MNPGGDHGKRELSPALANRFTAVWVPPILDEAELAALLHAHLTPGVHACACSGAPAGAYAPAFSGQPLEEEQQVVHVLASGDSYIGCPSYSLKSFKAWQATEVPST